MTRDLALTENGEHITSEEALAIRELHHLARIWPATLTLISMDGVLHVIHTDDARFDAPGRNRADVVLDTIAGIPSDGGAW